VDIDGGVALNELEERRKKIREKIARRSSPELFGIALVILIFAFLLFSSLPGGEKAEQAPATQAPQKVAEQKTAPQTSPPPAEMKAPEKVPEEQAPSGNVPPPRIVLYEPKNDTYTTSLPPVRFRVYGPYLDTVLLSIDGGENISIPHDGYIAEVDSYLAPVLIGEVPEELKEWRKTGNFSFNYRYTAEFTFLEKSASSPYFGIYLVSKTGDALKFQVYPYDSSYAPSGGFVGQTEKGVWKWTQTKAPVEITYNKPYNIEIYFENGNAKVKINDKEWLTYPLQNKNKIYDELVLKVAGSSILVNNIVVVRDLSNGLHSLTLLANNTQGNATSQTVYFTINATSEEEKEKIYTIGDTIRAGNLEVTLKRFYGMVYVEVVKDTLEETYSRVDIEVKNVGEKEVKFQFTPYNPVLIDDLGNTYDYTYVKIKDAAGRWVAHPDQLNLDVLYPGATRKGAIFFKSGVSIKAKNLTSAIYLNGEKYEFKFKRW
jgi:hypothetical protein